MRMSSSRCGISSWEVPFGLVSFGMRDHCGAIVIPMGQRWGGSVREGDAVEEASVGGPVVSIILARGVVRRFFCCDATMNEGWSS